MIAVKSTDDEGCERDRVHPRWIASAATAGAMACGSAPAEPAPDAPRTPAIDAAVGACPVGLERSGRHRLFVQGHGGATRADGRYPLLHDAAGGADAPLCDDATFVVDVSGDGVWQPGEEPRPLGPAGLVHGEHFLVGPGAFAEFATELCGDITGEVTLYIPNFDEAGSRALHQLLVVSPSGDEQLVAEAIDEEAGQSGYNPFVRQLAGEDPVAAEGDLLVLRSTNLSGAAFSVMVWRPPSEYESWVLVEVP